MKAMHKPKLKNFNARGSFEDTRGIEEIRARLNTRYETLKRYAVAQTIQKGWNEGSMRACTLGPNHQSSLKSIPAGLLSVTLDENFVAGELVLDIIWHPFIDASAATESPRLSAFSAATLATRATAGVTHIYKRVKRCVFSHSRTWLRIPYVHDRDLLPRFPNVS